jgi:hypothetical protein
MATYGAIFTASVFYSPRAYIENYSTVKADNLNGIDWHLSMLQNHWCVSQTKTLDCSVPVPVLFPVSVFPLFGFEPSLHSGITVVFIVVTDRTSIQ